MFGPVVQHGHTSTAAATASNTHTHTHLIALHSAVLSQGVSPPSSFLLLLQGRASRSTQWSHAAPDVRNLR